MKVQSLWPQQGRIWLAALCVALFAALVGLQTPALAAANPGDNDDPTIRGLVEQMPAAGLVGGWMIDSVTYTTTEVTKFEQEHGAFARGSCVKATLTAVDATTVTKLQTEPAGDCDGNGGGDNGGGDNGGGNGDGLPFHGLIKQMPGDGWGGVWIIGSRSFTTTATTVFEEDDGPFAVGACAKVISTVDGTAVTKLETEPAGDCDGNGGGDDGGGDHGGHGDGPAVYGLVAARPVTGTVGQWIIGGVTYTVTEQTELKTEYGPLAVGACVKAHLTADNTNTVRELESERSYHCNGEGGDGGDDSTIGRGQFFGAIVTLPAGFPDVLTGLWQVGNITVTANVTTKFKQEHGLFAPDAYVKVKFVVDANGQFVATEIKTAITAGPHGGDDQGNDDNPTAEGMTYGLIETLPISGLLGVWRIGDLPYQVNAATHLDVEHGPYTVGQQVKVEYRLDLAGNRLAKEIERSNDDGGVSDPDHTKLVGYVGSMPPPGTFQGDWQIAGADFVADAKTVFEEEHGLSLAVGSYVEAEYSSQGGVNVLHKVETRVPPGGGDDNAIGKVEDMGNGPAVAAASGVSWHIGGQLYQLTPATQVGNKLALDSTVVVNSFIDHTGANVATRISSITLRSMVFLPLTQR